jgi:hypothetical protein
LELCPAWSTEVRLSEHLAASPDTLDSSRIHRDLIEEYRQFTDGFIEIRHDRPRESVRD